MRDSMGYTDEIEKPSRNDTKLMVTIETKSPLAKKNDVKSLGLYQRGTPLHVKRR